ncbi:MAG: helix-turn-helix domain-containing protein [Prevotella sp.]|nr:helix-turn-helix domain-containing protein [Prevotella sp.]
MSPRTLQRYRTGGLLPFHKRGQKIYYRLSDVREFIYRNGDHWDKKAFEESTKAKGWEFSKCTRLLLINITQSHYLRLPARNFPISSKVLPLRTA